MSFLIEYLRLDFEVVTQLMLANFVLINLIFLLPKLLLEALLIYFESIWVVRTTTIVDCGVHSYTESPHALRNQLLN